MLRRIIRTAIAVFNAVFLLAGCGTGNSYSNSITAAGSTAMLPLVQRAAEKFMSANPETLIRVQGGGSGTGLSKVADKACDIGNSDVVASDMLPAEKAAVLSDHPVCVTGIAIVVSPDVIVTALTRQQLADIFTGVTKNWKDVGGNDETILILNRPSSSGTRAIFKNVVLEGAEEAQGLMLIEDSSAILKAAIAVNKGAISYLAFPYLDDTIKTLLYNGVEPTADNIKNGLYPLWTYEHMYTNGEATGAVKEFIDFMMSAEFAPEIKKLGYIPVSEMKIP